MNTDLAHELKLLGNRLMRMEAEERVCPLFQAIVRGLKMSAPPDGINVEILARSVRSEVLAHAAKNHRKSIEDADVLAEI